MIVREIAIRSSSPAEPRQRTALGSSSPSVSLRRIAPRSAPIDSKTSWRIWGSSVSMSTTWLIACVALYMTERLSRRSLSQSPTLPGDSRMREPSPTGMLRRIAERSSGLARPSMSTRAVSSLPASVVGVLEDQDGLPEPDLVARLEGDLVDRLVVEIGAVGRLEVDELEGIVDPPDLGVPARDLVIVEADRVRVVAAEPDDLGLQLEPLPLVGPFDDEQRGHATAPRSPECRSTPEPLTYLGTCGPSTPSTTSESCPQGEGLASPQATTATPRAMTAVPTQRARLTSSWRRNRARSVPRG